MITNLIDILFTDSGFKSIETKYGQLYLLDGDKRSFWLTTKKYNIDNQEEIFEQIKKCVQRECFDGTFDKNFNILFYSENITHQEIERIESDPYTAKKYVLPYKKEQLNKLKIHLGEDFRYDDCVRLITTIEFFNQYKSKVNDIEEGDIAILYSLFMKLPFLSLDTSGNGEITPLMDKISTALIQEGLLDWYTQLDSEVSKNFDKINQGNALELFKRIVNE